MDIMRFLPLMTVPPTALALAYFIIKHFANDKFLLIGKRILLYVILFYFVFPMPFLKNYYLDLLTYICEFLSPLLKKYPDILGNNSAIYMFAGNQVFSEIALLFSVFLLLAWLIGMVIHCGDIVSAYLNQKKDIYKDSLVATEMLDMVKALKKELHIMWPVAVYKNCCLTTPLTFGFFKPVIFLPDIEYTDQELDYIFRHELTHIRNCDFLIRMLWFFASAVHWFNPAVNLLIQEVDTMCELFCDNDVAKHLNEEQQVDYFNLILDTSSGGIDDEPDAMVSMFKKSDDYDIMFERMNLLKNKKNVTKLQMALSLFVSFTVIVLSSLTVFAFTEHRVIENDFISIDDTIESVDTSIDDTMPKIVTDIEEVTGFILDSNGNEIPATDIMERVPCNHKYEGVTYIKHIKYKDGTCKKEYYDAQECWKCNRVIVGAYQYSITFSKCDH